MAKKQTIIGFLSAAVPIVLIGLLCTDESIVNAASCNPNMCSQKSVSAVECFHDALHDCGDEAVIDMCIFNIGYYAECPTKVNGQNCQAAVHPTLPVTYQWYYEDNDPGLEVI